MPVFPPKSAGGLPLTALAAVALLSVAVAGCGEDAKLPERKTQGPDPVLPAPSKSLLPTVSVAKAVGWPKGKTPEAAPGLTVSAFASELDHPRWLYVLPNGDVLAAETAGPQPPEDEASPSLFGRIKGLIAGWVMDRAGSRVASPDKIVLLRDGDGDGVAEFRSVLIEGLHSPFGMALVEGQLYVANTDAVMRFPYKEGDTEIAAPGEKLADLPGGPINHHWTKSLVAGPDGSKLYVGVGSNSNAAENGLAAEQGRADILEIDRETGEARIYASGLRNPVGLAFQPGGEALWAVVNERDELGSDLVPDYLTKVKQGAFYGWPFSYWGQHVDTRVSPQKPALVAKAVKPDYALGNHVAPLGLAFSSGNLLPPDYRDGVFIGEHGSWNRSPKAGYKVVFVPFSGGKPDGAPKAVLSGFLNGEEEAQGRPAGVAMAKDGALLVADDVGGVVWRVAPTPGHGPAVRP